MFSREERWTQDFFHQKLDSLVTRCLRAPGT